MAGEVAGATVTGRPSTCLFVTTLSAGALLPLHPRCEKYGRPWMPSLVKVPSPISSARRPRAVSFLLVLARDPLLAAAEPRALAALVEIVHQLLSERRPRDERVGRRPPALTVLRRGGRGTARHVQAVSVAMALSSSSSGTEVRDLETEAARTRRARSRPGLELVGMEASARAPPWGTARDRSRRGRDARTPARGRARSSRPRASRPGSPRSPSQRSAQAGRARPDRGRGPRRAPRAPRARPPRPASHSPVAAARHIPPR